MTSRASTRPRLRPVIIPTWIRTQAPRLPRNKAHLTRMRLTSVRIRKHIFLLPSAVSQPSRSGPPVAPRTLVVPARATRPHAHPDHTLLPLMRPPLSVTQIVPCDSTAPIHLPMVLNRPTPHRPRMPLTPIPKCIQLPGVACPPSTTTLPAMDPTVAIRIRTIPHHSHRISSIHRHRHHPARNITRTPPNSTGMPAPSPRSCSHNRFPPHRVCQVASAAAVPALLLPPMPWIAPLA